MFDDLKRNLIRSSVACCLFDCLRPSFLSLYASFIAPEWKASYHRVFLSCLAFILPVMCFWFIQMRSLCCVLCVIGGFYAVASYYRVSSFLSRCHPACYMLPDFLGSVPFVVAGDHVWFITSVPSSSSPSSSIAFVMIRFRVQ